MSKEMYVCPECGFGYLGVDSCPRCHLEGSSDGSEIHVPWFRTRTNWAQQRIDGTTWFLYDSGPEPTDMIRGDVATRTCQANKHSFVGTRGASCPICGTVAPTAPGASLTEGKGGQGGRRITRLGFVALIAIVVAAVAAFLIVDTGQRRDEFSDILSAMEYAEAEDPWITYFTGEECEFPEVADWATGLSAAEAQAVSNWALEQEGRSRELLDHVEESIRRLEAVRIRSLPTHSGIVETRSSGIRHYMAWQTSLQSDIDSLQLVAGSDMPDRVVEHVGGWLDARGPRIDEINSSYRAAEDQFRQHQPIGDYGPRVDAIFDSSDNPIKCSTTSDV